MTGDNSFASASVLVVGGAGFVGSNLVAALMDSEASRIVIVDNLLSSDISNVPADPRVQFISGSIADDPILDQLPRDLDYVFHLACYHGNQSSIANPIADHDNNTLTSLKLFDRLSRFEGLKKVVYAAAGCAVAEKTFDDASATSEEAPVSLYHDSPYSISKLVGEMYANYYFARHKLPVVKARFQNVYGPREILGAGQWRGTIHTVWRNVTPTFIWRALHGEALPLDNGGNASRDFIYVEDIVHGLMVCALRGEPGEVYNLASGVETTILELANTIIELTGKSSGVDLCAAREWDRSGKRYGSTAKAASALGFRASVPLRDGLSQTIGWTLENKAVIERCIDQHRASMERICLENK